MAAWFIRDKETKPVLFLFFLLDRTEGDNRRVGLNVSRGRWGIQRRYCICCCFHRELCPHQAARKFHLPRRGEGQHCWTHSRSSGQHLEQLRWLLPEMETRHVKEDGWDDGWRWLRLEERYFGYKVTRPETRVNFRGERDVQCAKYREVRGVLRGPQIYWLQLDLMLGTPSCVPYP